jgi:predicted MFS family arabinose efflux permease
MMAALLPAFVKSLHVTIEKAGLLVVVYSAGAAIASFISGALSDYFGRRRFLQGGMALFAAASGLAWQSASFGGLVAARALTGLAAGTISTCTIAYAGDWFAYKVRGRAIGLISSAYFVAPVVGVPAAALIADRFGWRKTFLAVAAAAVVASLASLTLPKEALKARVASGKMRTSLGVFRGLLARRDTPAALGIAFLVSGGLVGFITYIGQWLNAGFALSTTMIGLIFAYGGGMAVLGAPLGGMVSDRLGKRAVSIASSLAMAAAVAAVPFLGWGVGLLIAFGAVSLAAAFRQGPLTALMTEMVSTAERGTFIALRNISSQFGIGATVYVAGVLYERSGYGAVTGLCAAMTALVAVLLFTHIMEPRPSRE